MYVTTERIIVNKGGGQLSLRAHFLVGAIGIIRPAVPATVALVILLAIAGFIIFLLVRRRSFRRKLFTIEHAEGGRRQFEVKRGHVLSIEVKPPRRVRSGHVEIVSLSSEPFDLKILGGGSSKLPETQWCVSTQLR